MAPNLLILGGTAEANALAHEVARLGLSAVYSYAGRVKRPAAQPLPVRVGGFGGVDGLAAYLRHEIITHVIDATHPFADGISRNALAACATVDVPLCALARGPWKAVDGDRWSHVSDIQCAVKALDIETQRVFLAIGRQDVAGFAAQPQHDYLLRFVDTPDTPPPLPNHHILVARGPFVLTEDIALMKEHRIDLVVSKNSGGTGARAKIDAARTLGLPVLMIDRPRLPDRHEVSSVDAVMDWLDHPGTERGV
jgi:precorrin-6A/cobalt-precorrin-6A reductase